MEKNVKYILVISLLALLILRVYSAFFTVPIVTWDDKAYRAQAISLSANYSFGGILKETIIPHSTYTLGKITNYVNWLVFGLKFFPFLDTETVFQFINLTFFVLQLVLIYQFTLLATGNMTFSMLISFLFMSSPMIFGISRWVLTENLVYTCLLACFYFPLLLIAGTNFRSNSSKKKLLKEAALTVLTAYLLVITATAREYVALTAVAISLSLILIMILQKRWLAAGLLLILLASSYSCFANSINLILSERTGKLASTYYYSPPLDWINHVALNAIGIPFIVLFIGFMLKGTAATAKGGSIQIKEYLSKKSLPKLSASILMLVQLFLFAVYCYGIYSSYNRGMRPAMLPFFSILGAAIIFLHLKPAMVRLTHRNAWFFLLLTGLSWLFLYYQLFTPLKVEKPSLITPIKWNISTIL